MLDPNRVKGAAQVDREESERLPPGHIRVEVESVQRGPATGSPIFDHDHEQTGTGPLEIAQQTGMTSEEIYFESRRQREKEPGEFDHAFSALARVSR
jgi:hypothetical protein